MCCILQLPFYLCLLFITNGRCAKNGCDALLRPHIVWFGESLFPEVLERAFKELSNCDLCLLVSETEYVVIVGKAIPI